MFLGAKCFYVLVVLGCCVIDEALSLRCYECTESEPKSCGKNFNKKNVTITDCQNSIYTVDDNVPLNRIYVCLFIKETDVHLKNSTYTRRCSIKNSDDTCENIVARNQISQTLRTTCAPCDKDLCNSSSLSNTNFVLLFVVSSFVVFRWCNVM